MHYGDVFPDFKNDSFQTSDQNCLLLILHDFPFTPEIFYRDQIQTVAQPPWEGMNAEILNCNCKICNAVVNKNLANLHIIIFCYFWNE